MRIDRADDDLPDAGGDQRPRARRGTPLPVARLERGHDRGPTGGGARLLEGHHLGVPGPRALVPALAEEITVLGDDDGAHHRVRRYAAPAALGELQGPPHLLLVSVHAAPPDRGVDDTAGERLGRGDA